MLDLVKTPHPVLATPAKKITKVDATILDTIKKMSVTLDHAKDPEGVGLAAPQVGISVQLFIVRPTPQAKIQVFINPVIEQFFDENQKTTTKRRKSPVKLEGCLSVDEIWGVVKRHKKVKLTYLDEKGMQHTKTFSGFLATIIQHEVDHLNGILFTKRVLEQKEKLYKSSKDEKGEIVFEEIAL